MTTPELRNLIRARYAPPEYGLLFEVGDATGAATSRHADAVAMSIWPSRGLEVIGMECKVYRSDWTKELRNPAKAESIWQYCDRWYLVVSDKDMVKEGELPPTWGLLAPKGNSLRIVVDPPKLGPKPLTRSFVAAMF